MAIRHQIHIRSDPTGQPWEGLLPILEQLLSVKFNAVTGKCDVGQDVVFEEKLIGAEGVSNQFRSRTLTVPRSLASTHAKLVEISVTFSNDAGVPFPFQGRSLKIQVAREPKVLPASGNDRVLATSNGQPIWVVSEEAGLKHYRSGFALPEVGSEAGIKDVLNEQRFMEILPLLHWIRELCSETADKAPPLRACFIFDDPNLHWKRYGFVDFQELAERAARRNYHVAFATIPLDAWFTHEPTAEVFRNNLQHLSLTIHGNDHTKKELAQNYTPEARVSLLRQAIHRIERLETLTRLSVCRVMVPPHGACSEKMLAELTGCGFEAACISHGSLRAHNYGSSWSNLVGYFPSELVRDCPVLPRWGFSNHSKNAVLLAAFLGQPMVFRGHHQDLKNGIELLDDLAEFINGLGPVSWSNLTTLCRMNYKWRIDGMMLKLRPLGSRISLQRPEQATKLVIESPFPNDRKIWNIIGANGSVLVVNSGTEVSLPETFSGNISIMANGEPLPKAIVHTDRPIFWPFVRRLLAESRDRFLAVS